MKYIVTSSEMKAYDNNTITHVGIPGLVLMERAALAVRDEILKLWDSVKQGAADTAASALIVAGHGNNGADGLALARLLAEKGFAVTVKECGDVSKATDSYRTQRAILAHYPVCFSEKKEQYDFVVDGIFGVGLSREVNEYYASIIEQMNEMSGIKVAIDIPSGIDAADGQVLGCAFRADVTVTFGFGKRGLYLFPGADYAGRVEVAEIGIDERGFMGETPRMFTFDEDPASLMPVRRKDGNKGTFGKVLVIAGWEHMAGAAIMSAGAVLQTGAGMVKVFCSEENRSVLQCALPEAMYGSRDSLERDMEWADVILAGPGMGQSQEAQQVLEILLRRLVKQAALHAEDGPQSKTLLLDADALNMVSASQKLKELVKECPCVIMTPHVVELSRLTGQSVSYIKMHTETVAKEASLDYDSVMVCKDARTLVYQEGQPMYLNLTGNSGMATAGSGDVLAGVIAGLAAQGESGFMSACKGVYLHGLAGDKAAEEWTEYGVTATKITAQIRSLSENGTCVTGSKDA